MVSRVLSALFCIDITRVPCFISSDFSVIGAFEVLTVLFISSTVVLAMHEVSTAAMQIVAVRQALIRVLIRVRSLRGFIVPYVVGVLVV